MARRGGNVAFKCAQDGCSERALYPYTSQADYGRLHRSNREHPWKCSRHRHPEQVLTPTNTTRDVVLVAEKSARHPHLDSLFWRKEGDEHVGSGFIHGPGFSAHASDFPEGTRLAISVAVETPDNTSDGQD